MVRDEHDPLTIIRYVEGLLDPAERERFELHLVTCIRCRLSVADNRRGRTIIGGTPLSSLADMSGEHHFPGNELPVGLIGASRRAARRRLALAVFLLGTAVAIFVFIRRSDVSGPEPVGALRTATLLAGPAGPETASFELDGVLVDLARQRVGSGAVAVLSSCAALPRPPGATDVDGLSQPTWIGFDGGVSVLCIGGSTDIALIADLSEPELVAAALELGHF